MIEKIELSESVIDDIAAALQQQGYLQLDHFLPNELAQQLQSEAQALSPVYFVPAGIGRNSSQHINARIRTDTTLWLDGTSSVQQHYLAIMDQLRMGLNRRLFMGLYDFECHFSHYSQGDFYKKHFDAFKQDKSKVNNNRSLSTVFYLNPDWAKKDGGELLLYADEQPSPVLIVPPTFNSCIIFLSDTFPHEVLTSNSDRYSIAGWYKTNGIHGQ
jgi:SM-20-related protein